MKKQLISTLALTFSLGSSSALATNGYFTHGYGIAHKGMAGAGLALSEELMSGANNPANLLVERTQFSLGLELFSPDRKYTASSVANFFPDALYLEAKTQKSEVLVKTGLALNQPRCQIFAFHIRTTIGKSSGNAVTEGMAILFITPASMHP